MYIFTGLSKWNDAWLSGDALEIALSNARLAKPLGEALVSFPALSSAISRLTLFGEIVLPILLFSPWKSKACRTIVLILFLVFHVVIQASMEVMLFSYVSLVGLIPFIPSHWWNRAPLSRLGSFLDKRNLFRYSIVETRQQKRQQKRSHNRDAPDSDTRYKVKTGFIAACLLYILVYNVVADFASSDFKKRIGIYQRFGEALMLKQHWNMFSDPSGLNFEVACVARLRDNTQIDLLRKNAPVEDKERKPEDPAFYANTRTMILLTALTYPENEPFRKSFVDFLCRQYNQSHPSKEHEILECFLEYYLYGYHPLADKSPRLQAFHADLRATGKYLLGNRNGAWILRNDAGQIVAKGSYLRDIPHGQWTFWRDDGTKKASGKMAHGKLVGVWKYFDESGNVTEVDHGNPNVSN